MTRTLPISALLFAAGLGLAACGQPAQQAAPVTQQPVAHTPPTATTAPDLSDLVGARGGQAEGALAQRGYVQATTRGSTLAWWNAAARSCVRITTSQGRYSRIVSAPASACGY